MFIELTIAETGYKILINVDIIANFQSCVQGCKIYETGDKEEPYIVRESYEAIRKALDSWDNVGVMEVEVE